MLADCSIASRFLGLQMVKLYEGRQYKKSVKACDAILKKHPNHGETTAMKGLNVFYMGKKAEAYELTKLGLRYDLKSHVCWHVLGIMYRADKNYPEAVKCYKNALRIDPENYQILRDLANLQIHLRDLNGNVESRRLLLSSKQGASMNWLGFSVGHQLAGNADMALAVLDRYDSTLDPKRSPTIEDGELVMYQSELLRMAGTPDAALALLSKPWTHQAVTDDIGLAEHKARLQLDVGDYASAVPAYLGLVHLNPDNHDWHAALQSAVRASSPSAASPDALLGLYSILADKHPRCRAIKWITLHCLPATHPVFKPLLAAYIRAGLRRGIPALYSELKGVCAQGNQFQPWSTDGQAGKADIVLQLAQQYYDAGNAGAAFETFSFAGSESIETADGACSPECVSKQFSNKDDDVKAENPATLPFTALLYACCLDKAGKHADAVAVVNKALEHSPTVLELYLCKARCLKHTGDLAGAAAAAEQARSLDLADRHLNGKAVKYFLRANDVEQAEKLMALFARQDSKRPHADPLSSVHDVQTLWFEMELGAALERRGDFGPALKQYTKLEGVFDTFFEDAFDYHQYCLRRATLRVYSAMLNNGDVVRTHPYFVRSALGAARVCLALHRDAAALDRARGEAKAAAATANARTEIAAKEGPKKASEDDDEIVGHGIDTDPSGSKLLTADNWLAEAWKHAKMAADALPASTTARDLEAAADITKAKTKAMQPATASATTAISSGVDALIVDVHVLCAEVAAESQSFGAAATHIARALAKGSRAAATRLASLPVITQGPGDAVDERVKAVFGEVAAAAK